MKRIALIFFLLAVFAAGCKPQAVPTTEHANQARALVAAYDARALDPENRRFSLNLQPDGSGFYAVYKVDANLVIERHAWPK